VQAATWAHTGGGMRFDRDLCVCAPTVRSCKLTP